jgi:hypothetical protein
MQLIILVSSKIQIYFYVPDNSKVVKICAPHDCVRMHPLFLRFYAKAEVDIDTSEPNRPGNTLILVDTRSQFTTFADPGIALKNYAAVTTILFFL